ncbi:protein KIAA0100 isoform X2 [Bradysia coprophila]|uniref:protein KIAA0100 isoform X2 n=1 Tax=Bradysia coprophila TaxID=38358 RepID=UPI00187DB5AD|nr:protein KIAA0100 isoform X2 [Bradysia coprophila]
MNALLCLLIIAIVLFVGITWVVPKLIGYVLLRKFKVHIQFGRIGIPFSLKDVKILKNGFSLHIDEICIRSSFFNSEVTKLLSINIRDIRINKDINKKLTSDNIVHLNTITKGDKRVLDFRNKKIPPSIIKFVQFMAVHIHNISLVLMNNNFEPNWLLHATATELHLDGSIVHNTKSLIVTAALNDAQAKMLRQYPVAKNSNDKSKSKPCLAELSFGIALDAVLIASGQPSLEKIHVAMNQTKTIIHGGLYDFIRDAKSAQRDSNKDIVLNDSSEFNSQDFYERISPIIPKNFLFKIESARVSAVKDNSSDDFAAKLKLLMINGNFNSKSITDKYQLPTMYTGLQLQYLEIDTKHEKLLFVEQFTIDSKLEKDIINTYFKLKTFQLIYNHTEIYEWVKRNIFTYDPNSVKPLSLILPSKSIEHFDKNNENVSFVNWVMSRIVIKGCAELWNISMLTKLNDETAAFSVSHLKLILEQFDEKRSNVYSNRLVNAVLNNRHWSIELMIESLWWSLGNATSDTNFLKKIHTRGSPFFMGVSLIKLSSYGNATKLDLSVHTLRTEYSKCLAEFLLKLQECGRQYGIKNKPKVINDRALGEADESNVGGGLLVNAKITDVTTFFFNNYEACMLISLTEVTLARTQQITVLKLNGFQTAILGTTNDQLMSLNDFTDIFGNIKVIRVEYGKHPKMPNVPQFNVYILKDTEAMWNSNVHMHIVTLIRDMQEFRDKFHPKSAGELDFSPAVEKEKIEKVRPIIDVYAEGTTVLGIKISDRHSMQIFLENFYFSFKERIVISTEKIFINIDEMHIFTLKDVDVQSLDSIEVLKAERQNYENFVLPTNKVWITTIGGFKGIFPYDHDFADAIQNEFVSLFKWLKLVHNVQKKPFTKNSPLPRDMIIQVKEFLLELSDDPFEVKLRDNYVLLVDEYHESLKRKQLFDQKIRELCSERLLLPTGTIEELYSNLVKKNSEIYIQRSKKINEAGPTRTRLFSMILMDLQIMAMADPSIHGKDNVTNMMREIDAESPWPEEGLDFVTLWCRAVNVSCSEWKFMLRDFPQPMFSVKQMRLFGNLCGAEQMAPARAKREVSIEVGDPFGVHEIQRSMTSLKFYHDFDCEYDLCSYAFGPCWEPVMAQCNLSFEKISTPSKDPSPAMPFWDKMRLLFHGRLTMIAKQFTVLLHASLDPYNTTEEMELSWHNCGIVWTNAKVMFKGELNVCVRTASRYDDCRLLHFPNLKLTFKLNWICLANPNDHHAVIPCAPDKLPEYSSNQVHDSFRAFRSQNLNIWVSFETKPAPGQQQFEYDLPNLVLYGSTLRWFESLQLILSGVTRPTRRGPVFNNIRPRKKQLSRHYRKAHLQMSLHKFQVLYWMSHALHRGFELNGGRVTFSSEHTLTLHPIDDGLIHRQRADWSTMYMNCEVNNAEIWLKSILNEKLDISSENITNPDSLKIVKFYFLSLAKVSYGREAMIQSNSNEPKQKDAPVHKLVVYDLKGAWTKNNRDVAFALFDSFMKSQKLKNNLSTEALKGFRKEGSLTPLKSRRAETSPPVTNPSSGQILGTGSTSSAITQKQQTSHAANMLQQLIAEADHKFNVYSDDLSTQTREAHLQGLQACQDEDVTQYNWFISLVNSQVLLKGCETSGYVILSAAKAEILQRVHRPVWRDRSLVSKTTWVGFLECMQYYATVSPDENDSLLDENIMWLTLDNIEEKDKDATVINELPDIPHLVGSGHSVGGVVSETVGATGVTGHPGEVHPIQLQRIVSRCKCEFFYVSYGDAIDPSSLTEVPPPPTEETISPWEKQDEPVDAFTLMHHDLDVCTNSLQYAMILDIVNNLMLYVEPQRKQALEKLARMRFQLQFSGEDQKRPIQHLQTQVRSLMSRMRSLEKDIHLIGKARAEEGESEELKRELEEVQKQIKECKDLLTAQSEELDMMLSCYKETQLSAMNKLATIRKDRPITIVRANEICFKHAQWRLTEADGQIGIADLILSNFLYTKKSKNDDSVEHLLELGYIRMNNLIPRENYKEVLCPTEIQKDMPVDHQRVIRVFCREKPPVGGISVKEHFEINVVPITIAITKKFYSTMLKFCFPDRDPSDADVADDMDDTASVSSSSSSKSSKKVTSKLKKGNKDSEFYVRIEKDDVEKMKERAEKNKLFIYIKIPEVPVRVSYKGNKEKNFEDITDFSLVIPTLEYHNVTWTWLDLLLAMKSDSRRVILSQAIKQKLQIHRHKPLTSIGERSSPQEEDKAKMLFGNRQAPENKSQRRGVFKFTSNK